MGNHDLKTISLKGITGLGRNRITEHGSEWIVCQEFPERLVLQSITDKYYFRNWYKEKDIHLAKM